MVNGRGIAQTIAILLFAALVLTAAAWLRGAEYDEQYTLFLTAGTARPELPETAFPAGAIPVIQSGHGSLSGIATALRRTDVHPPLYFWAVSLWRGAIGSTLFEARAFSVLCGVASLALVGALAARCRIPKVPAMLLTLGSDGFVYTSVIARGFALAQLLTLAGVLLLTGRRTPFSLLAAGALFGAAAACNYLAVFVAVAAGIMTGGWLLLPAAAPFLALDAWFFAAQHGARDGQFPPFSPTGALPRLAGYETASLFGGLPLYAAGNAGRIAIGGDVGALMLGLAATVLAAGPWAAGPRVRLLAAAAVSPPIGLLLLGVAFNNTPIELRYLSFGVPFIGLLMAWACTGVWSRALLYAAGTVQCAAIAGLMLAPATMQPARAAAHAAADLDDDAAALVPRGNDGVGIVGAFGSEAPAALPMLLVRPTDTPAALQDRTGFYQRVILALLGQDRDSNATLPIMHAAFAGPGWRRIASGSNIEVYERE
ncbi:MAG: hypothetical protein ACJ8AW_38955 [Rhodopila sp.]